jgi:4-amino-4-deoxy-L-arabinose transferase-like glycosyltransferase
MLCKGPIGAAIPAFAVVGHILMKKDFKFLFDYRWFLGIIIAFIVASPAMIGLMNQFGWKGIWFFFWENNVGRITGSYLKSINDPFYYFHNILYLFLPWSLLFFTSVFFEFKMLVKSRFSSNEYFTFTGIWIFFIILSSASFQLPNYIFSIVPLIAVLTAKWVDISLDKKPKLFRTFFAIQNVVVTLFWILVFAMAIYLFPFPKWYFWFFVFAAFVISGFVYFKTEDYLARIILPTITVFTVFTLLLNMHIFPYMFSFQAPPKAARYFNENANEGDKLYNYKYGQYELFFYSEPQATKLDSITDVVSIIEKKGSWIFTNPEGLAEIDSLQVETDTIIEYKHLALNRGGRFLNPKTRDKILKPMYLIKLPD